VGGAYGTEQLIDLHDDVTEINQSMYYTWEEHTEHLTGLHDDVIEINQSIYYTWEEHNEQLTGLHADDVTEINFFRSS
jgi:hypothetical protein